LTLANQGRAAVFGASSLANAQALLASVPTVFFRDIGIGSNGYNSGAGFDLATGRGSPWAPYVLYGLIYSGPYSNYGGSYSIGLPVSYNGWSVPTPLLVIASASRGSSSLSDLLFATAESPAPMHQPNPDSTRGSELTATSSSASVDGRTAQSTSPFAIGKGTPARPHGDDGADAVDPLDRDRDDSTGM
jgi:hypothetical protein